MAESNNKLSLDSMGGFVYFSLDKILKLTTKSRDKRLRTAAVNVQKAIFVAFQKDRAQARKDKNADKYFLPFKLACDYNRPNLKMLHTSLDAIQRMIAYGYLSGDTVADPELYPPIDLENKGRDKKDSKKPRKRKLIDVLVETIYMCSTMIDDDQVQIQVIKTLITAVQSKTCPVHDHSILLAVRSCYHIYLTARNTSNQTTARAILTQMLNVVFRRMEALAVQLQETKIKTQKTPTIKSPNGVAVAPKDEVQDPPERESPNVDAAEEKAGKGNEDGGVQTEVREIVEDLVNKVAGNEGKDGKEEAKAKSVPQPNSSNAKPVQEGDVGKMSEHRRLAMKLNVMQNDAYLLFRALTQLSMKKIPDSVDPVAIKSKALALELLLSVIQNSGPMLRTHPKFVGFIKEKLVRSLLQNCVSPIPKIYKMAAPMFLALVAQFKPQMKYEIGVILNNIFLNMLASPMSSYMQKSMAVVILLKLCKDPQTIVELFLNFDCDPACEDKIFESIIIQLEKVAQGRFMSEALMSPQNEQSLRLNALEALGHAMSSLINWCRILKKEQVQMASKERKEVKESAEAEDETSQSEERAGSSRPAFSAQFNMQRERRNMIEKSILLFNRKPKKGIKFLFENGLLKNDPKAVADFLKTQKKLDKTQIGEFLGDEKEFNKKVLYKYIEDFDFRGMEFDEALRYFLKGFRLPGEGQKIDRMVVKFADQYTLGNPYSNGGKFRTADGAYVLAYATIMLHTDLHNPGVKNKMSKEQFISINRGIDDGNDIDPTFMSHLYDKIQQEEIHMTDNAPSEWQSAATLNPRKRQTMFQKQTENLIKKTENLIRKKPRAKRRSNVPGKPDRKEGVQASGDDSKPDTETPEAVKTENVPEVDGSEEEVDEWYDAKHADLDSLQPMFDLLWCPAFATFSLVLKENDETRVANLCLENYRAAVQLSSIFSMDTPRDAFMKSLQHFSLLGTSKPLGYKNVEAIKMLLQIAYTDGDYLKDSWSVVLQCISEYDKLMRRSPASQTSVDVFESKKESKKPTKRQFSKIQQVHHQNAEILREQLDPALVDRVFTHSANLSSDAIVDFVRNLTQVSQTEVYTMNETPRVFSLQKIVEITYYNMNRIRLVWTRIWSILSAYFAKAGCHPNLQVSLYSIDSLRQLAMKFLEKDELAHYHFQKQFLKPFELIMANTQAQESKALIIQCISRMVLGRVSNVRSGWKSVFVVLRIAASSSDESLVHAAFALMERIMLNYFTLISNTLSECVSTLSSFAGNKFTKISLKSLDYIQKCANWLASEAKEKEKKEAQMDEKKKGQEDRGSANSRNSAHVSPSFPTWLALLTSCSQLMTDKRLPLQTRAMEILFDTLSAHGDFFTLPNWENIFTKVLFPVFNGVGAVPIAAPQNKPLPPIPNQPKGQGAKPKPPPPRAVEVSSPVWLKTTCLKAMTRVVQLFAKFQLKINSLLPDVLALINSCTSSGNYELACIGIQCWRELMSLAGDKFDDKDWTLVLEALHSLCEQTLPHELQAPRLRKSLGLPGKSPRKRKSDGDETNETNQKPPPVSKDKDTIRADLVVPHRVAVKCEIHRQMLEASFSTFEMFYNKFTQEHVESMLATFKSTIVFLSIFNSDVALRKKLFQAGFKGKDGKIFTMIDQEVQAYGFYMKMLQIMYKGSSPKFDDSKAADARLREVGAQVFKRYTTNVVSLEGKTTRDLESLGKVVCSLVEGFSNYSEHQLKVNMPVFFPWVLKLVEHGDLPIRRAISAFISKRITPLLPFEVDDSDEPHDDR
uniref:SEC7 domain-containing protein n=1 Tax=Lotharella globosa TaxID=91324 RepID=A0A7S3ZII8_9EUKA|mmetsp:Transcript_19606/g.39747  ORF Transcript_19606/g.39747 Transcript_19606/m.39747 type:complete len:1770 (+) Transcript_19606:115-5424(+)